VYTKARIVTQYTALASPKALLMISSRVSEFVFVNGRLAFEGDHVTAEVAGTFCATQLRRRNEVGKHNLNCTSEEIE